MSDPDSQPPLQFRTRISPAIYFFFLEAPFFLAVPFRPEVVFFLEVLFFLEVPFFLGTFAPAFLASDSPIAMACLRLLTRLPPLPLFKVPRFRSCIARLTFWDAFLPYLAICYLLIGPIAK